MKKIGFYPGSMDPFTNGHLHVIKEAVKIFDELVVGIGVNTSKTRRFDREVMKKAIEEVLLREKLHNVKVVCFDCLGSDAALEHNAIFLVKGIRNGTDYAYEENIASANEEVSGIDTIYIRAGKLSNVSSSMVMELLKYNKDVSKYVPEEI